MADERNSAVLLMLNELADSDDEKPTGRNQVETQGRVEREEQMDILEYDQGINIEDRFGFREIFWMDVGDFDFLLNKISHLIIKG